MIQVMYETSTQESLRDMCNLLPRPRNVSAKLDRGAHLMTLPTILTRLSARERSEAAEDGYWYLSRGCNQWAMSISSLMTSCPARERIESNVEVSSVDRETIERGREEVHDPLPYPRCVPKRLWHNPSPVSMPNQTQGPAREGTSGSSSSVPIRPLDRGIVSSARMKAGRERQEEQLSKLRHFGECACMVAWLTNYPLDDLL
ncbi:hypothetical protein BD310DRAFT_920896 [Dichomitus squalens]|uniref:Uncharacterized protein n=1 Tax=Dichomitus squalens TaxID=114155 RepID=A0A4Q9Q2P2_9APHY|nr:hypothetical protein BD310DRAFT_920896 [Dichomitus squalens]